MVARPPTGDSEVQATDPPTSPSAVATPAEAASVLFHMSVATEQRLYVLGSYESRVTIYSQQIRAFNLAYALASIGQLGPKSRIAVVGGGVAGITFAAAASRRGASVVLFERRPQLLHLLRGCHTRHLHPNVYDWPAARNPMASQTELPFMNWHADTADAVARHLLDEFRPFEREVEVRVGTTVLVRGAEAGGRRLTVTSPLLEEHNFHAVVLAVGFGLETTVAPHALRSYWRDDSLHQPEIEERAGGRTQYLVSGNGDGGLIDILRLRISDFRHESLLQEITANADLTGLVSALQAAENEARSEFVAHRNPDPSLYQAYRNLRVPPALDGHLSNRLRHDTHVVFNYPNWPLSVRSSILHRLLVSRLLAIDTALQPLPGRLISVEGHEPNLRCTIETDHGRVERSFHRAVIRHGPRPALGENFPSLHARFEPDLRARNALDVTRRQAWPPGFFDVPSSGVPSGGVPSGAANATSDSPVAREGGTGATEPTTPTASEPEALKLPSSEARQLREALLIGDVGGLEEKLALLTESEKLFLVRSLTEHALENEDALRGFRRLLASDTLDKEVVSGAIVAILRRAAFMKGIPRKVRTLELPPEALLLADQGVLRAFFADILDIVDRDQFDEVNAIMPALALAQAAIPAELYSRYFHTLVRQARSSSYQGAPAARRALVTLTDDAAKAAMKDLNPEVLGSYSNAEALRSFVERHRVLVPADKEQLVKDFLDLSNLEFRRKYEGLD